MKIENGISLKAPTREEVQAKRDDGLRQAAKMYETHFLNEMVKAMRSTVGHDDGFMKQNMAEKIFSEQLDQQYVDNWAGKGGVGLADMIYTQIHDKYYGSNSKNIQQLPHALPIEPKKDPLKIPSPDSIQMKALPPTPGAKMSYRFEVQDPSAGEFEIKAPMPGKVADIKNLEQGWSTVKLDHGQGLSSELTFPGRVTSIGSGHQLEAGQKLGVLDPARPVLAWNLDWNNAESVG